MTEFIDVISVYFCYFRNSANSHRNPRNVTLSDAAFFVIRKLNNLCGADL